MYFFSFINAKKNDKMTKFLQLVATAMRNNKLISFLITQNANAVSGFVMYILGNKSNKKALELVLLCLIYACRCSLNFT
jgi:hypothetical protein